jgi:hypothetical protein
MDEKNVYESCISEYKSLGSFIIESKTFDNQHFQNLSMNLNQNNTDISQNKRETNTPNNFKELSILKVKESKRTVEPHLLVEDKGFKNENYRNYEISYISSLEEKAIKCYRRFSHFDTFNQKLQEKYPYAIIPSLPQKNYASKIVNIGEDFYINRVKELNFYLNYIFNHDILKGSSELNKFLNDAEFVRKN